MNNSGVTLMELLLVVAMILILSTAGSVFYSRFVTQNALSNTVDQIVQTMRKAQTYSMVSRKDNGGGWGVSFTAPKLTLYQGSSFVSRNQELDEEFSVTWGVSMNPSTFDIHFARGTGLPSPAPTTIRVTGLSTTKTITINAEGMVSR